MIDRDVLQDHVLHAVADDSVARRVRDRETRKFAVAGQDDGIAQRPVDRGRVARAGAMRQEQRTQLRNLNVILGAGPVAENPLVW